jgi:hypothetical protein
VVAAVAATALFAEAACAAPSEGERAVPCDSALRPDGNLQRFVARLRPGETGCLAPGQYDVPRGFAVRRSGRSDARITLTSRVPSRPALIRGRFWVADSANWWTFSNLRFDGRNEANLPSPTVNGDGTLWRDLDVTNHRAGAANDNGFGICFLLGSTAGYGVARDTVIERSLIHDCGASSNHNHAIYVEATRGTTIIRDNVIARSGDRGIQLYPDGDGVLIEHNALLANGSGVIFSGVGSSAADNVTLKNNVIAWSVGRWNVESYYPGDVIGQGNVVVGNCLWARNPRNDFYNQRGGIAHEIGFRASDNRLGEPRFRDAADRDYRVAEGTTCVGTGPRVRRVGAGAHARPDGG